jgi:hypothetical protein
LAAAAWVWRTHALLNRQQAETEAVHAAIAAIVADPPANAGRDVEELNRLVGDARHPALRIRDLYLDGYNFAGLVRYLRAKSPDGPPPPAAPALLKSAEQMAAVKGWVTAELQGYTQQQPLRVFELSGTAPKELHVFTEADRRLYFVWGGAVLGRDWADVKPASIAAVIVGALRNTRSPPDREVVNGALAFARIYGEPEMIAALQNRRIRPARTK